MIKDVDSALTVSYKEAAELLGVSERTIRRHAELKPKKAFVLTRNGKKNLSVNWLIAEFPGPEKTLNIDSKNDTVNDNDNHVKTLTKTIEHQQKTIETLIHQAGELIKSESQTKMLL